LSVEIVTSGPWSVGKTGETLVGFFFDFFSIGGAS